MPGLGRWPFRCEAPTETSDSGPTSTCVAQARRDAVDREMDRFFDSCQIISSGLQAATRSLSLEQLDLQIGEDVEVRRSMVDRFTQPWISREQDSLSRNVANRT